MRSVPVERITWRKFAPNNSNGIARGSRNSKTIEYAGASCGRIPRLLAASPTNVLTNAALTMLPILVFSDLVFHKNTKIQKYFLKKGIH
jgi:hypothetical protein